MNYITAQWKIFFKFPTGRGTTIANVDNSKYIAPK
jgi:hypothetical protein